MKRIGLALLLASAAAVVAQPTYNNRDIDSMRSRYAPKRSKLPARYPREFDGKAVQAPTYVPWFLPYQEWQQEYKAYFQRHYHDPTVKLDPKLICMHYTVMPDAQAIWESFRRGCNMSAGKGSVWGHVSVHLMIDQDGTVYQLLPFDHRCTGAYGVNHKAISIEMVATTEADLLSRPKQVWASFMVVKDLMKRYNIPASGVIAHYEVSQGKSVVPDYLDYADPDYPDRYPSKYFRSDPGPTYMSWLRSYVHKTEAVAEKNPSGPGAEQP